MKLDDDSEAADIVVPPEYQSLNPPKNIETQAPIGSHPQSNKADIDSQWTSKSEYKANRLFKEAPTGVQKTFSLIARIASIVLALAVLVFVLGFTTPLGDLGTFTGSGGRDMAAQPIIGISSLLIIISYFIWLISSAVAARSNKARGTSIIAIALGLLLLFNPIGLIVMLFVISCNLQSCSGS